MKRHSLLTLLLLIYCLKSNAQITFEPGYFIDNHEKKVECLIKNTGKRDNPTTFEYKMDGSENVLKGNIQGVKEFSVPKKFKYQRFDLKIDKSNNELNGLSDVKNIRYKQETLFLQVLLEGKASLYLYEKGKTTCFFFQTDNQETPQQLIYKRYYKSPNQVGIYHGFRTQLWIAMKSKSITLSSMDDLDYKRVELEHFFEAFNKHADTPYTYYQPNHGKSNFKLSIRPGIQIASLTETDSRIDHYNQSFGTKLNIRIGLEGEFILPFQHSKWALFFEPTLEGYQTEKTITYEVKYIGQKQRKAIVDYHTCTIPLGIRYYSFLDNQSKVFFNGAFAGHINTNSRQVDGGEAASGISAIIGAGFKYKDRYIFEARYNFNRDILAKSFTRSAKLNTFSFIFGYTIPSIK